jgi:hypothetical protein
MIRNLKYSKSTDPNVTLVLVGKHIEGFQCTVE